MKENKNRVVIVGAGVGGMTAAAYLCREDYDVLLIDKNDYTGGLVQTFEREGFSFDSGPRAFLNSGMLKPILNDLGIEWETMDNKVSIAIEDHKFTVESMESIKEYQDILLNLFPDKAEDIDKIMKSMKKLSEYTKTLYAFDNPYFVDYMSDKKRVITQLLPWTFKLLYAMKKFEQYDMPMEEYLSEFTDSQPLKDIITQVFFRGTPTYFALGYFYVWLDYFYPKGGIGVLPKLLHNKIAEDGCKFKLNTEIKEIMPAESKVIDTDGNEYEYDYLIWAADLKTLYKETNSKGLENEVVKNIELQTERILAAKPAESVFIEYLALDIPPTYFKDKGGAHVFYTDSKQGLGELHRGIKEELLENFDKKSKEEVFLWLDELCKYNTYEISIPALRDASLAPVGQSAMMISCLFDYEVMEKIDKAGWTKEFKERMEENIINVLSATFYKELDQKILFKFSSTPTTISSMIGSSGGAIVGWSFETKSPVINTLKEMPKSALTPIPNVFQAGQWAYAPAGVPVAMLTGWHSYKEVTKKK